METHHPYFHPQTLIEGQIYYLLERSQDGDQATYTEVMFVAYTPCPGIVVISNGSGHKVRCLREDLFICIAGSKASYEPQKTPQFSR